MTKKILIPAAGLLLAACIALVVTGEGYRLLRRGVDELLIRRGIEKLGRSVRVAPRDTPYDLWVAQAKSRIPIFEGLAIDDIRSAELRPWPQMGEGVSGLYLRFSDYQITDGRILEIPAHGSTAPQRHLYEVGVYFLDGPGRTVLHQEGKPPEEIAWSSRSLLSIPLNVRYQHRNDSAMPVRLLAVTSFPLVMNMTNSESFVLENTHEFTERYDGAETFAETGGRVEQNHSRNNLVPDVLAFPLDRDDVRGEDASNLQWLMAGNTMLSLHASEIPAKTYKKAHRHSSDAFILILSGTGYSVAWPEGAYERRVRVDWRRGTLFVPPMYWYHQHLNTGSEPARYLAINAPDLVRNLGLRFSDQIEVSIPEIQAEWEAEIGK